MRAASIELESRLHRASDSAVIAAIVSRTGVSEDAALMNGPFVGVYEATLSRSMEVMYRLDQVRRGRTCARQKAGGEAGRLYSGARRRNAVFDSLPAQGIASLEWPGGDPLPVGGSACNATRSSFFLPASQP